jgi:hippurate hydrolase
MDALDILEENTFAYRSVFEGKMHGCGHDGHTTMLLSAAEYLQNSKDFNGTVNLIFQPAEENEGGGREMVTDGLFDKFPWDAVFGMHNIPGIPAGHFGVKDGPMMASFDIFDVEVTGKGTHAAWPHTGTDTVLAVASMIQSLQSVVSRSVAPLDAAVVSATKLLGGNAWNTLPERAGFGGTTRTFRPEVQDAVEAGIRRVVEGQAKNHCVEASVRYERRYPPTINTLHEAQIAGDTIEEAFGAGRLNRNPDPLMAAEDFAFMLQERPGCYIWLGNGSEGEKGGVMAHKPLYDFNDDIIPFGANYWVHLTEKILRSG